MSKEGAFSKSLKENINPFSKEGSSKNIINNDGNNNMPNELKRFKRKHKKSKNGCSICKERGIRCDQKVPTCSNCDIDQLTCPYSKLTPYQIYRIIEDYNGSQEEVSKLLFESNINFNNDDDSDMIKFNDNKKIKLNHFDYGTSRNIDLDNSIYQAHEMESALLPSSMSYNNNYSFAKVNDIPNNKIKYIPLKTNYMPSNETSKSIKNTINKTIDAIPLSSNSSKISFRSFKINSNIINKELDEFTKISLLINKLLINQNYKILYEIFNGKKLDYAIRIDYIHVLSICQIFNKLLRKSFLLLSMDYYKNTILKQKMLPNINYKIKITISCECENSSVISIGETTKIIKDEYLPYFNEFTNGNVNLFAGSFLVLNDCLVYHFKNGLKYDINKDEGNKAVKLVGIFLTGLYSIAMERSRIDLLMSGTNIISAHLITHFKRFLIPNYSIKAFDDFKYILEKSSNEFEYFFNNNNNNNNNLIDFENLKIFLKKQSKLLKLNLNKDSLLGFNNGYLIRIMNSFESIIPFDLCNLNPDNKEEKFPVKDVDIMIVLFYYSLSHILDGIIPSIENAASSSFVGPELNAFEFGNIKNLMKLFKLIKNKTLKLIGIYLIRTALFFKNQRMYYQNYLAEFTIDSLLDEENDLNINQRYSRLKKIKNNGIMDEIQVKNFLLDKGQFFKIWNYPNFSKLKPKRKDKVSNNKIMNYFNNDEDALIEDFIRNNNGFFSLDYDCSNDLSDDRSIAKETTFINGDQMKMLWKLSTYIRINNL